MRSGAFSAVIQVRVGGAGVKRGVESALHHNPLPGDFLNRGITDNPFRGLQADDFAALSSDIANGAPLALLAASVQQKRMTNNRAVVVKSKESSTKFKSMSNQERREGQGGITPPTVSERENIACAVPISDCENRSDTGRSIRNSDRVLLADSRSCPDLSLSRKEMIRVRVRFPGNKGASLADNKVQR